MARLGSLHGFQVVAYYINTKRNALAGGVMRVFLELSAEELQAHVNSLHPGLVRRDYGALLNFFLLQEKWTTAAAAAAALDQGLKRAAQQAAWGWRDAARSAAAPMEAVPVKGGFVEASGGVGTMARAAVSVGL